MLAFIEKEDFEVATSKLIEVVLPLQVAIKALATSNKSLESNAGLLRILLKEEFVRNKELV